MAVVSELALDNIYFADLDKFSNCRIEIISDQGDYKLIMRVCYYDFIVQILIPRNLTEDVDVIIRCLCSDFNDLNANCLKQTVLDFTKSHEISNEKSTYIGLVSVIEKWIDNYNIVNLGKPPQSEDVTEPNSTQLNRCAKLRRSKLQKCSNGSTDNNMDFVQGKPPMKTASDVISRIIWDSDFPEQHFVVGYTDRMLGIIERPFVDFDWSNFNTMDQMDNAIPRHRIQYFKYKNAVVWDRNQRYDVVFGSTFVGGRVAQEIDIFKIMSLEDANDAFVDSDEEAEKEPETMLSKDGIKSDPKLSCSDGPTSSTTVPKPAFEYFLYLTIPDPRFIQCALNAQETLSATFPEAVKRLYDINMLHITIALIGDVESIECLITSLSDEESVIIDLARKCTIDASELSLLKESVIVTNVLKTKLNLLVQYIANIIAKSMSTGLNCTYEIPELLHITLGRIKKPKTVEYSNKVSEVLASSKFRATSLIGRIGMRKIQDIRSVPLWEIDCGKSNIC